MSDESKVKVVFGEAKVEGRSGSYKTVGKKGVEIEFREALEFFQAVLDVEDLLAKVKGMEGDVKDVVEEIRDVLAEGELVPKVEIGRVRLEKGRSGTEPSLVVKVTLSGVTSATGLGGLHGREEYGDVGGVIEAQLRVKGWDI